MRKIILLFTLFLILGSSKMLAQYEGTFGMGVHTGYAKEINSVGGGVHLHYYYTNNLRFAPSYTAYIPVKGRSMWDVDLDAHYMIPLNWEFSFYPIGGLSYTQWKYKPSGDSGFESMDWSKWRPGLNLGVGFQYDFRYKVRAGIEMKYQAIKDFSQVQIMFGIGFWI